jgi:transcriptional regulator with XRE-family HTH domain
MMQRFGEKLRLLRKRHGLTVRELAEALGYTVHSNSYISQIENGKQKPSLNFVTRTAQFFQVSLDQLSRDELELDLGDDPRANEEETR